MRVTRAFLFSLAISAAGCAGGQLASNQSHGSFLPAPVRGGPAGESVARRAGPVGGFAPYDPHAHRSNALAPSPSPSQCPSGLTCVPQGGSATIPDVGQWTYQGNGGPVTLSVPMTFTPHTGFSFAADPNPVNTYVDFGVTIFAAADAPLGPASGTVIGQFPGTFFGYVYVDGQFGFYVIPGSCNDAAAAVMATANAHCNRDQLQIADLDAAPVPAIIAPGASPVMKLAGQHVQLQAQTKFGAQLSNITWTVNPKSAVVAGYALEPNQTNLPTPQPLVVPTSPALDFYWTRASNAGQIYTVTLKAQIAGGATQTVTARYTIANATLVSGSGGTANRVGLCHGADCTTPAASDAWTLTFGRVNVGKNPAPGPGMTFDYSAQTPSNGLNFGELGTVQLISFNCVHDKTLGTPSTTFSLDNGSFYPAPNGVVTQALGETSSWLDPSTGNPLSDSPSITLNSRWKTATLADDFETYYMFAPPIPAASDPNVIWVPVGRMTWGFRGSAMQNIFGKWVRDTSQPEKNPPATVNAVPWTDFPTTSTTFSNGSATCAGP